MNANSHRTRQAGAQMQFGRLGAEKYCNVHVYLYLLQKKNKNNRQLSHFMFSPSNKKNI